MKRKFYSFVFVHFVFVLALLAIAFSVDFLDNEAVFDVLQINIVSGLAMLVIEPLFREWI